MKLSKEDIQEVKGLLEAGRPLPDKYRFLLFKDKNEVELVWNGKTRQTCDVVLPFQTIEHIDKPRLEESKNKQVSMFDPVTGRQIKRWTNKLIWGDNKLILSALKNGPLRDEIDRQGGIKLIYIDPPFDVGADFSMDIKLNGDTYTKQPSVLEEIAYRDTWGKGADSFIAMMYERLKLMRGLLADDGSIYVHCDWRVSGYLRLVLDEVFGKDNFVNEIIWRYEGPQSPSPLKFASKHDTVFRYSRNINRTIVSDLYFLDQADARENLKKYQKDNKGRLFYTIPKGDYTEKSIEKLDAEGKVFWTKNNSPRIKKFVQLSKDKKFILKNKKISDVWDITSLGLVASSSENLKYPTQKPSKLLERIIKASSNPDDLVADFFCGSGTTCAVAEKLGRKWIGCDLGRFAIHTTRKRLIAVQRQLKQDKQNYRAFEILNLGKYERRHYVGINHSLTPDQQDRQLQLKEEKYIDLILTAYFAQPMNLSQASMFHGKKQNRAVAIGPLQALVDRTFTQNVIDECLTQRIKKADILAFEFEMGLAPQMLDEAKKKGVHLALKYIPKDVFDKRAVDKGQVIFYDVAYLEVKPHIEKGSQRKKKKVALQLTDFSVYYAEDPLKESQSDLGNGKNKVVLQNGKILRISKDKKGKVTKEVLTKRWFDWIDYWSIDFDFESKKEMIKIQNPKTKKFEDKWSGDYIFENEWQSFRTKQNKDLELKSPFYEVSSGKKKIAIRAVDIFGNDTMKVIEIQV